MNVRIGDGSGNEDYRTCAVCGADCEPEIFDGGEDRAVFVLHAHVGAVFRQLHDGTGDEWELTR